MDTEHEDLGPAGAWQIREFPKTLRKYLAELALKEEITVSELLTQIVIAYRDGRLDVPRNTFANGSNDALSHAIGLACRLSDHAAAMPKGVAALAYGLVKAELRGLRERQSNGVCKPVLTHQPVETEGNL